MRVSMAFMARAVAGTVFAFLVGAGYAHGADPVLLAEIRDNGTGGLCCLPAEQLGTHLEYGLLYGFGSAGGTPNCFGTAESELGCGFLFLPGELGFVDFNSSNAPDFAGIVSRVTNGLDDTVFYGAHAVNLAANQVSSGSLAGGPESLNLDGINRGSVDLQGETIDFVRLLVNGASITHTFVGNCSGVDCYNEALEWEVIWQFWQGQGLISGGGQRSDVDDFLSYFNPLRKTVELSAGTTTFQVGIAYAATIDVTSFEATLNGSPFGGFGPEAGSQEIVAIPVQSGRNTLVLTVEGTRSDGRIAVDRDRLTFIVP